MTTEVIRQTGLHLAVKLQHMPAFALHTLVPAMCSKMVLSNREVCTDADSHQQ